MLKIQVKKVQIDEGLETMDWLVSEDGNLIETGTNITEEDFQEKRKEFLLNFFSERGKEKR